jgi:hypothetical protein
MSKVCSRQSGDICKCFSYLQASKYKQSLASLTLAGLVIKSNLKKILIVHLLQYLYITRTVNLITCHFEGLR